nr:hypothetical protein [Granulicella sp. L60]
MTGADAPASTASIDAIKRIFNTNFFGTVEFTQPNAQVVPLLWRANDLGWYSYIRRVAE